VIDSPIDSASAAEIFTFIDALAMFVPGSSTRGR
jgi:hypothetical protein